MLGGLPPADPLMRRLTTIPRVGGLTAHAIVTAIGAGKQFRNARDFAAWCGLTSREGRPAAAQAVGPRRQHHHALCRSHTDRATPWQRGILVRRPVKSLPPARTGVAVLAQAAKTARIAWAMLVSGETYRKPSQAACG